MKFKDSHGVWLDYDLINKLILYASKKSRIVQPVACNNSVSETIIRVFNRGIDSLESYLLRLLKDYVFDESYMKKIIKEVCS